MAKKISISIDEELLESIDQYARKSFLTRSGFISVASTQFIMSKQLIEILSKMDDSINRILDTDTMTDEDRKVLTDAEKICRMIKNSN